MNRNSQKAVIHDSSFGALALQINSRPFPITSKICFQFLVLLFSLTAGTVLAQTNFSAWCLIDTPPITGTTGAADTLASGLTIGEVNDPGYFLNGLYRSELNIQLPPEPANTFLSSASLALYLEQNTGTTNGNGTFGPVQVYHESTNQFFVSDSDYSDGSFSYVAALVNPTSPTGRYYSIDVTHQIAADYARDFASTYAKFRLQVDGLQYIGGTTHSYQFYFSSISPAYPAVLDLKFEPLPELSLLTNTASSTLRLLWPTNFGDFVLESTVCLTNPAWSSMTNTPAVIGDHFGVDIEITLPQRFFRLHRNP